MVHVRSVLVDIEVPRDAKVFDVLTRLQDSLGTKKQKFRLVHHGKPLSGGPLPDAGVAEEGAAHASWYCEAQPAKWAAGSQQMKAWLRSYLSSAPALRNATPTEESNQLLISSDPILLLFWQIRLWLSQFEILFPPLRMRMAIPLLTLRQSTRQLLRKGQRGARKQSLQDRMW